MPGLPSEAECGGATALGNVDLDVCAGGTIAIVDDNGAGRSTLIRILTGVHQPASGEMTLEGRSLVTASQADAISRGIGAVYQTLALADHLTPAANMFLGSELTKSFMGYRYLESARMRDRPRGC